MFLNFIKVAFRNLIRNKSYTFLNLLGLAVAMTTTTLIGLWLWDETTYNKSIKDYDRVVQVMHHKNDQSSGNILTRRTMPLPTANELRTKYGRFFDHIALVQSESKHVFEHQNQIMTFKGSIAEPEYTKILSPKKLYGDANGLKNVSSIMISQKMANSFFGDNNPIGKTLKLDNQELFTVTAVFENFQQNTDFEDLDFILPWAYIAKTPWIKDNADNWGMNGFQILGKLKKKIDIEEVSTAIEKLLVGKPNRNDDPKVFLHPLSRWHLYSEFKNGQNIGGNIRYVNLFTTIALFVLALACINFMNLSTARSLKRAKEVGIRKTIGSSFSQLSLLFLSESIAITFVASILAFVLVAIGLPWFNNLTGKTMSLPIDEPMFWGIIIGTSVATGLISGSYPALFLASFNPLKALKGTLRIGLSAAVSRKVLVVMQFTVSTALIVGTAVVFKQIQYAQSRPLGYEPNGVLNIPIVTNDFNGKYDLLRNALINSGAASNMAQSFDTPTKINANLSGFDWKGKDPSSDPSLAVTMVTHDYGKTINWELTRGRDFSRDYLTDSTGVMLNEAAVRFMGFDNPINETIKLNGDTYHVIGIIQNRVVNSPFDIEHPTVYLMGYDDVNNIIIKINPNQPTSKAIKTIASIFKRYIPTVPFEFSFVDQDYANQFALEKRVGKISTFFACFAILISCLGIFGLSSFMIEQRTKEIGIRKVLGASTASLWKLLSRDFILLVVISILISIPLSWYFLNSWLDNYEYRTVITFDTFIISALGITTLTLMVVSLKTTGAAKSNPIKAIRSE